MEQITREEIIGLLQILADLPSTETKQGRGVRRRVERAIAALQAAEPVGYGLKGMLTKQWDGKTFVGNEDADSYEEAALLPLFTLPCQPAKDSHWSFENPGRADQYRAEALAARRALGFREDADDVAPADLEDAINALRQPATELAPESWREELETIAEILEADGDEWNCAARIRKMLTASSAPDHNGDGNEMVEVPFHKLALGTRFRYTSIPESEYVKISATQVARWQDDMAIAGWAGQGVYSFDEKDRTDTKVLVAVPIGLRQQEETER